MRPTFLVSLVALIAACSKYSDITVACTLGSGSDKTCFEVQIDTTADNVQAHNDACTNGGGIASSACSHDGADGACRFNASSSGDSQTVTAWVYAGDPSGEKANCISAGHTWITP